MPIVIIPPPYRGPTQGEAEVEVDAANVLEALEAVEARHPGFGPQIFSAPGKVHRGRGPFLDMLNKSLYSWGAGGVITAAVGGVVCNYNDSWQLGH